MYQEDSFFSLSVLGQIGLALLSLILGVIVVGAAWRLMANRGVIVRLGIAAIFFFSFVWLSPQIFYTYYYFIFEGLDWQNVLKRPPQFSLLFELVTFQWRVNLSAHSKGVLFWVLIGSAIMKPSIGRHLKARFPN